MFTTTANRVSSNTDPEINARIWHDTEDNMREVAAGGRAAIERRLRELDEEWDIERWVETMAPSFTLIGLTLGLVKDRRWLLLPLSTSSSKRAERPYTKRALARPAAVAKRSAPNAPLLSDPHGQSFASPATTMIC